MNQKGFVPILIIIIVAIAVVLGGWYYLKKSSAPAEQVVSQTPSSSQPVVPSSTAQIDTSNWKIYRNEKYGFEVKYLPSWEINSNESGVLNLSKWFSPRKINQNPEDMSGLCKLGFYVVDRKANENLRDWLTRINSENAPLGNITDIIVDSHKGIKEVSAELGEIYSVYLPLTDNTILSTSLICGIDVKIEGQKEFDQILSTVKFTQPISLVDTSNWKSFIDEKNGFEVKFPGDEDVLIKKDEVLGEAPIGFEFNLGLANNLMEIESIKKDPNFNFDDWVKNHVGHSTNISNRAYTTINNIKTLALDTNGDVTLDFDLFIGGKEGILIEKDMRISLLEGADRLTLSWYPLPAKYGQSFFDEYNKILSTFKFIAQTSTVDTSNWKTYTNTQYGFEFKYPANWTYETSDSSVNFFPPGKSTNLTQEYRGDITVNFLNNLRQLDLRTFYQSQNGNSFDLFTNSGSQKALTVNGYSAEKFIGVYGMIPTDTISIRRGKMVIEFSDIGQQHAADGILEAVANSIK